MTFQDISSDQSASSNSSKALRSRMELLPYLWPSGDMNPALSRAEFGILDLRIFTGCEPFEF